MGLTSSDVRRIIWTAIFTFGGVYASLIYGLGEFKSVADAKAAALALLPTAIAAAASAVKNAALDDGSGIK
jgi:hypothetical protein